MEGWRGREIGGYRLGAMRAGDAQDARFEATDAAGTVATVRLLAQPNPDDRWFAERVARELGRYVGVTGPHLAPLLAVGETAGRVYLVAPPVEGETLRARIGTPRPLPEVIALLGPIAAALDALHARWLPHGGLRPEAIALTADGPFLCDAGLVPALEEAARFAPGGTPATPADPYRAPENASSSLRDPRADIYSLAALAWELLTGRPPAPAHGGATDAPANLPPALVATLRRGLARSPYERPDRASAFVAALRASTPDTATAPPARPSGATPPSASPPVAPPPPSVTPPPIAASPPRAAVAAVPITTRPERGGAVPPYTPPPLSEGYRYAAIPLDTPRHPAPPLDLDDPALVAARAALVTTLATIANGRGQLTGTLRAVALARGGVPRRSGRKEPAPRPHAKRRDLPERRAAQYVDNWREVYQSLSPDRVQSAIKRYGSGIIIVVTLALVSLGPRALVFLLLGAGLIILTRWLVTPQETIVCTPAGFTVERGMPFRQPTRRTYRWGEIAATGYIALSPAEARAGRGNPASQGHFFVYVGPEIVFDRRSTLPPGEFARLVERFSWMTPHLPYEWIPTPDGRFRKVSRDRPRDGA